jgi:coenzyme F420-reducing hydrogenase delta subunit/predicted transcriptional regulator
MVEDYSLKVLVFVCERCTSSGIDSKGISASLIPPNIRVIATMCAGRIEPLHILDALRLGFDHVVVLGCHPGDCQYHAGDVVTRRRVHLVDDLLEAAGIGSDRVSLRWVNTANGQSFLDMIADSIRVAAAVGTFDRKLYDLQLTALEAVLNGQRIRWLLSLDHQPVQLDVSPGEMVKDEETFRQALRKIATDEYVTVLVLEVLRTEILSIREVAIRTGLPIPTVSIRMKELERRGLAERRSAEGSDTKFRRLAA